MAKKKSTRFEADPIEKVDMAEEEIKSEDKITVPVAEAVVKSGTPAPESEEDLAKARVLAAAYEDAKAAIVKVDSDRDAPDRNDIKEDEPDLLRRELKAAKKALNVLRTTAPEAVLAAVGEARAKAEAAKA